MADLDETVEAQGGILLAHSALFAAVLGVLRERGVITQGDVNDALDAALTGVENSPPITAATTREARVILEKMAREMAGPVTR